MNPDQDFSTFSGQKWQDINVISQRIQALNSLLDFFCCNEPENPTLADDCQAIADILLVDFEDTVTILLDLIEVEDRC